MGEHAEQTSQWTRRREPKNRQEETRQRPEQGRQIGSRLRRRDECGGAHHWHGRKRLAAVDAHCQVSIVGFSALWTDDLGNARHTIVLPHILPSYIRDNAAIELPQLRGNAAAKSWLV